MKKSSERPADDEIENTVNKYSNMLFGMCLTMLGSAADAEDAVADTFLKYIDGGRTFADEEHKKAWLLRVAVNRCHDIRRFSSRCAVIGEEELSRCCAPETDTEVIEAVMRLPEKYKSVIYLFYIAGYKTQEIASILSVSPSAVRKRLQYGRERLRLEL